MKTLNCLPGFLQLVFLLGISAQLQAQTSYSTIQDVNNSYGSSVPPGETVSYLFATTVNTNGCQYNWVATNSSNSPDGLTVNTLTSTFSYAWKNVNANATVMVTLHDCTNAASNGVTATYSVPIRYLGQVGGISPSFANPLSCGAQTVTFSAGAATNATNYQWDYSNLPGWTYVSGQGTTTLTMISSANTGGSVSITARRSDASNVATSSTFNVSRPAQPTPTISGPAVFCVGNTATYSVSNFLDGSAFNWDVSSTPNLQIASGQGSTQVGVQGQSEGSGTVTVNVTNACGTVSNSLPVSVGSGVGGYYTNGYDAPRAIQDNNSVTLQQNSPTGTIVLNSSWGSQASYSWVVTNQSSSGSYFYYNTSDHSSLNIHCDGGKYMSMLCTVTTPCGTRQISFSAYNTSSYRIAAVDVNNQELEPGQLIISPNPTKGATTVRFRLAEQEAATLSVVNLLGVPLRQQAVVGTGNDQTEQLELGREASGMYLIRLQNAQGAQVGKVMLER